LTKISNSVIWITGASSGIGEALSLELAKYSSVKLILSSRKKEELERVAQQTHINKENILILPLDLADYSKADEWITEVLKKFGRIDILINNGGISQRSWAKETPIEIDKQLFEINYFGTIALTKAVLKQMIIQQNGHIITISSIAGKFGFYLRTAYSASKHALHGFFDSLRLEVEKENIKVTLICPGKIKTNISKNALKADGSKHEKMDAATDLGLSAEKCASRIIQALIRDEQEVLIGGKEIIPVYIKRFFPQLLNIILRKQKIQ
jgi:dehydrogenase/reductase SDR family protein 7B